MKEGNIMQKETLVLAAKEASQNAYAPYSHFHVGAAILLTDGTIIKGANVENISFGATNCAERSALFTAASNGYRKGDFAAIAIYGNTKEPISPCGICRQALSEFLEADTPIYLVSRDLKIIDTTLAALLPYAFEEIETE